MPQMTFTIHAADHERFVSDAFAGGIGKPLTVRVENRTHTGKLVSAVVDDDGSEVRVTIDVQKKAPGKPGKKTDGGFWQGS